MSLLGGTSPIHCWQITSQKLDGEIYIYSGCFFLKLLAIYQLSVEIDYSWSLGGLNDKLESTSQTVLFSTLLSYDNPNHFLHSSTILDQLQLIRKKTVSQYSNDNLTVLLDNVDTDSTDNSFYFVLYSINSIYLF